ncbi:MAG TPA: SGNH/GDSL hydrolase family protein, partial [Acidimicrobiales bacterium]|nr:SGNH/GDSL hydrolase family protein [Acidimicrobiales bacterium]
VVAIALCLLGRPAAAVIPLVVAVVAVHTARVAPQRMARIEGVVGAAAAGLGRVVGVVLHGVVQLVVVTPASLVQRVLGLDVLPRSSGWHPRTAGDPRRAERTFGDDRQLTGSSRPTVRTALALVGVGVLLAWAVPRILDRGDSEEDVPTALRGGFFSSFSAPALQGLDWTEEAQVEFGEVSASLTYTSYVGSSLRDHEGRYVNVTDRRRRSYEAEAIPGVDPIDVWFFGGSTTFGFSAQRDLHTIPSEVVRLAEDDGVVVRAHNFGQPGYVNLQETILMAQLLTTEEPPDLVVFYDGINDTAVEIQQAFGGIGTVGDPTDIFAYAFRQALAGTATPSAGVPAPLAPVPPVGRPPGRDDVVEGTMQVYGQGLDLARRLAEAYGFPVVHFWQPDLFNTDQLVPGEQELLDLLGLDEFRYGALRDLSEEVADALPPGVIDITDAYDGRDEAVLTDQAHTNEVGARMVAEAMYEHLRVRLGRLADGA